MKVICGIKKFPKKFHHAVLVIGVFDGLHQGHRELIRRAVQRARATQRPIVVMTFDPHPVNVLHPEVRLPLIVSLPYRLKLIEALGVDAAVVISFTKTFSRLNPENFIKQYLVESIQPREVFVGDDFRFGQGRIGTIDLFKEVSERFGFHVNTVHPIKRKGEGIKISSTTIRQFISDGKLAQAQRLLGRRVSVMGRVVKGDRRGRLLGFPTANILPHDVILPPIGVYAIYVHIDGRRYHGMANIGRRPSFEHDGQILLEAHIFHFHQNLYGKNIIVEFVRKIRDEKIFVSRQKLTSQLQKDQKRVERILQ